MMSHDDVTEFERVHAQLHGAYAEISALSSKKPGDAVNSFKLRLLNTILDDANDVLGPHKPFEGFTDFNEEDVPTNSDVLFILSQYMNCMETLRADNITTDYDGRWYWQIDSERHTAPPRKLKY